MKKPELLSPAGDFEKLRYAVDYGADAVYLAGQAYGMRAASGNFAEDQLAEAVEYCHDRGVSVYVTVNTMPRSDEIRKLPDYLRLLDHVGVDAIIAADLGVISLAQKHARVPIHVSTQASVVNYEAAIAWYKLGVSRIVLARELSFDEIACIRENTPADLELEAFVHGAMCMAYSGRCMLSGGMTGRDANRGQCAQPCRWSYRLMEEKRPGEYFPVYEDETGTHIFNSKDLCTIEQMPKLLELGLDSLKIEGRVKTFYYAAVVTGAYRRAIDWCLEHPGAPVPQTIAAEVHKVSHREYYTGFYFPGETLHAELQQTRDSEYIRDWDVCAVVEATQKGKSLLRQKNKFSPGDSLELLIPGQDAIPFTLDALEDEQGNALSSAPHPHMALWAKLPVPAPSMSLIRKKNTD